MRNVGPSSSSVGSGTSSSLRPGAIRLAPLSRNGERFTARSATQSTKPLLCRTQRQEVDIVNEPRRTSDRIVTAVAAAPRTQAQRLELMSKRCGPSHCFDQVLPEDPLHAVEVVPAVAFVVDAGVLVYVELRQDKPTTVSHHTRWGRGRLVSKGVWLCHARKLGVGRFLGGDPARRRQCAWGMQRSSYSAMTISPASGPQAGQAGSRRTLKVRNDSSRAS